MIRRFISFFLTCIVVSLPAIAAEDKPHHPPQDMKLHAEFYSNWKKADGDSCCNNADCYPTKARFNEQSGLWEALRREDKRWIRIPRAVYDNTDPNRPDSPDGRAHLCAPNPKDMGRDNRDVNVYCFRVGLGI
ncbi:MAG: hypothetical protein G01um101456_84 [Parcubacteria group bacterium Gr01-1014_56]|nr:MAG: hypothetical protein G01um101456_84 [Parcubacteria group bacterium Gr01-1014_56]